MSSLEVNTQQKIRTLEVIMCFYFSSHKKNIHKKIRIIIFVFILWCTWSESGLLIIRNTLFHQKLLWFQVLVIWSWLLSFKSLLKLLIHFLPHVDLKSTFTWFKLCMSFSVFSWLYHSSPSKNDKILFKSCC